MMQDTNSGITDNPSRGSIILNFFTLRRRGVFNCLVSNLCGGVKGGVDTLDDRRHRAVVGRHAHMLGRTNERTNERTFIRGDNNSTLRSIIIIKCDAGACSIKTP